MNDWKAIVIASLLCIVATSSDSEGLERVCSDENIYCEDR